MIQRPQSIFLLIVIIALLTANLVPIWAKSDTATSYLLNTWCLQEVNSAGTLVYRAFFPYALVGLLNVMAVGVATYALFRYDHRRLQLKLGGLNAWLMVVVISLPLYLSIQKEAYLLPDVRGKFRPGFFLLLVAVASNLLANHCIRKDERRVRAADRIR